MLSAVILGRGPAPDLAALMSVLVAAAMDGTVRELLVAGEGEAVEALCEDAGARRVPGGADDAARIARNDWLLVLPLGLRFAADWRSRLSDHLQAGGRAAVLPDVRARRGPLGLLEALPQGVIAPRDLVMAAGAEPDLKRLARQLPKPVARIG